MKNKRLLTILLLLALVTVSAVGSWFAGSSIQSPAEAAARTAPPVPSPILVPVEERVLSSDVVTRGTARFGLPQAVSLAPSALKSDGGIITTLPERATLLHEGDVLLTASARPVFMLQGQTPVYRDLVPGAQGDDVRQLEQSLVRLGFDPGAGDGLYDADTSAAVAEWYTASGFEPFGATAEQQERIRTLEKELVEATNKQLAAGERVGVAALAVAAARAEAEAADMAANAALEQAVGNGQREVAQATAHAVQLAGEVAVRTAIDEEIAAGREHENASELAAQISADLESARCDAGIKVPFDEILFLPALPVRIEEITVAAGDEASGPVMTVTNNQLAIDASLPLEEAALVKPGMAVTIDEPDLGVTASGVVSRVAASPGTDGVDGYHIYFETLVDETPIDLDGFSLRLTIPVESTRGKVTAVPINALSLTADGSSRVQVDNNGALEFVVVEPGLSAGGFVEVTPLEGELKPGQLVVIGFDNQ